MSRNKKDKISAVIKGHGLCVKYVLTIFYPADTLPDKLSLPYTLPEKVHEEFIIRS